MVMCKVGLMVYYIINLVKLDRISRLRNGAGGGRDMELVKRIVSDDSGQGLVEYAFILMLVALGVIVLLETIGKTTSDFYNNTVEKFP